jgi:hypothetical protein
MMLHHVTVEFIYEDRKCCLDVPASNLFAWRLKIVALKAFTDISDPVFIRPTELAGICLEMN